jgi:hypothetical protein
MTNTELISALQMAIGPVVLISGVGLLLLSLTNRLGRVVDRGRILAYEKIDLNKPRHPNTDKQLQILTCRARLLRRSIFLAVLSLLFSAVLIAAVFVTVAMKIEASWLIIGLFIGALGSLTISLIDFLREIRQALIAFELEIK